MSIIAKRHYSLAARRSSNHDILQNRRRSSACEVHLAMEEVRQLGKNGEARVGQLVCTTVRPPIDTPNLPHTTVKRQ